MMDRRGSERSTDAPDAVEAALARVLNAEHEARCSIEAAQVEAGHRAEQARAEARRWVERGRSRIARGQAAVEAHLQVALAALAEEARALPEHDEPDAAARTRVEAAVQRLAAALTGGLAPSGSRG